MNYIPEIFWQFLKHFASSPYGIARKWFRHCLAIHPQAIEPWGITRN
ncbi:hypothetical protein ACE1AT_14435 [Pelatocladus sp. BLCC-F211]